MHVVTFTRRPFDSASCTAARVFSKLPLTPLNSSWIKAAGPSTLKWRLVTPLLFILSAVSSSNKTPLVSTPTAMYLLRACSKMSINP